jgi:hypothetical protein
MHLSMLAECNQNNSDLHRYLHLYLQCAQVHLLVGAVAEDWASVVVLINVVVKEEVYT